MKSSTRFFATLSLLGLTLSAAVAHADANPCLAPIATPAAAPCRVERSQIIGDTLYIEGDIDGMSYDVLMENRSGVKIRKFELNSYGGDVEMALMLVDYIKKNQIETHVRDGAFCASSCVMLLRAGKKAVMNENSSLGLHAVIVHGAENMGKFDDLCTILNEDNNLRYLHLDQPACVSFLAKWSADTLAATNDYFQTLENSGALPRIRQDFLNRDKQEDWYNEHNGNVLGIQRWVMTPDEALRYSLVTEIEKKLL